MLGRHVSTSAYIFLEQSPQSFHLPTMIAQNDIASSVVCLPIQWIQTLVDGVHIAWLDIDFMLVSFPVGIVIAHGC